jgi:hypothetical protein
MTELSVRYGGLDEAPTPSKLLMAGLALEWADR